MDRGMVLFLGCMLTFTSSWLGLVFAPLVKLNAEKPYVVDETTNDVYPTAVRLTMLRACPDLIEQQRALVDALMAKAVEFDDVIKVGRTQLMDAVPMRLATTIFSLTPLLNCCAKRVPTASLRST